MQVFSFARFAAAGWILGTALALACSAASEPGGVAGGDAGFSGTGGAAGTGGAKTDGSGGTGNDAGLIGTGATGGSGATGGTAGAAGSGEAGGGAAGVGGQPIDGGGCIPEGSAATGGSGGWATGPETCGNGLDDDGNGFVDESCDCTLGQSQPCYDGPPQKAGVGECVMGIQGCEGTSEFHGWGPCTGSVAPAVEQCEGAHDENCDGHVDESCECCTGETRPCGGGVGVCTPGTQTCVNGVWGDCQGETIPGPEICDNGIDDNCDGLQDEGCILDVTVNIDGDCVYAACPPQAPYPVGCNLVFSGNDPRGCVANQPGDPLVYFQEGDKCSAGHVSGTLSCSSQPPASPLAAGSCPINKSQPFYPASPSGCP